MYHVVKTHCTHDDYVMIDTFDRTPNLALLPLCMSFVFILQSRQYMDLHIMSEMIALAPSDGLTA